MIQMTESQSASEDDPAETTHDDGSTGGATSTSDEPIDTTMVDPSTGEPTTSESSSEGGAMTCMNMLGCTTAMVLGVVSGDENSDTLHASGSEPTWVTFRVTENNEDISGEALSFMATLTSPPGYDFDLYAYRGSEGGMSGCGGVSDESTGVGMLDVVDMNWGEGAVANGGDESAWVALQIEVKNGMCDPTAEWTLEVEGDP